MHVLCNIHKPSGLYHSVLYFFIIIFQFFSCLRLKPANKRGGGGGGSVQARHTKRRILWLLYLFMWGGVALGVECAVLLSNFCTDNTNLHLYIAKTPQDRANDLTAQFEATVSSQFMEVQVRQALLDIRRDYIKNLAVSKDGN
jgi:hypothetical protein